VARGAAGEYTVNINIFCSQSPLTGILAEVGFPESSYPQEREEGGLLFLIPSPGEMMENYLPLMDGGLGQNFEGRSQGT